MFPEEPLSLLEYSWEPLSPGTKTGIEGIDTGGCHNFLCRSPMVGSDNIYQMGCFQNCQIIDDGGPADATGSGERCGIEATSALCHEQFCKFEKRRAALKAKEFENVPLQNAPSTRNNRVSRLLVRKTARQTAVEKSTIAIEILRESSNLLHRAVEMKLCLAPSRCH